MTKRLPKDSPRRESLPLNQILIGDCIELMASLPDKCVDLVFADPPYNMQLGGDLWRPNMTKVDAVDDAWDKFGSFAEYDAFTRAWLTQARRVLKDTGTLWVIGSYHCLYRVGAILQDLGFWLLNDVVWIKCLAGTTRVYVKTEAGERPMAVHDLIELPPSAVQLWNGRQWTQAVGWQRATRSPGEGLDILLRSGERLRCTEDHQWPTQRGLVQASALRIGDVIQTCQLPEPPGDLQHGGLNDEETGWFVGMYLAEGSRYEDTLSLAGHTDEVDRVHRIQALVQAYHGSMTTQNKKGKCLTININGKILNAIIDTYVAGADAKTKHLKTICWSRSNDFLRSVLLGYLEGDGSYYEKQRLWGLGFAANIRLEADLRTLAARLGASLRLKTRTIRSMKHTISHLNGRTFDQFYGTLRLEKTTHGNTKHDAEIIEISRCNSTHFFDIAVADGPHLFALASGVLTHNSNPTPQMRGTRFCNAHETLLWAKKSSKQTKYTFHYKALKAGNDDKQMRSDWYLPICSGGERETVNGKKAHTTQKPESLLHRIISATSNPGDIVLDPFCGTGTTAAVAKRLGRDFITIDRVEAYVGVAEKRLANVSPNLLTEEGVMIDAPKPRVPFISLVEGGRLAVGAELCLKGTAVRATIHDDGTITADGRRGSIHKIGALCLGLPTCNGWLSWYYADPNTGEQTLIDALRSPILRPTD